MGTKTKKLKQFKMNGNWGGNEDKVKCLQGHNGNLGRNEKQSHCKLSQVDNRWYSVLGTVDNQPCVVDLRHVYLQPLLGCV